MKENTNTQIKSIAPAFTDNNISILFSTNDNYVMCMSAMIQSILEHSSPSYNYDIVILHTSVSSTNISKILGMKNKYQNVAIRFYDVTPFVKNYDFFTEINGNRLTREAYYRLLSHQVLSKEYTRSIYCDVDMVTLTDVAELNSIDIRGYYLAAARDITGIASCHRPDSTLLEYRTKFLKLQEADNYFISALLILNLDMLREDFPENTLLELASSRDWKQHDQDVLNYICKGGKAKLLDASWNVMEDYGNNRFLPPVLMDEWLRSERNPKIIHYGGQRKPWKMDVVRQEFFWLALAETPFFEEVVTQILFSEVKYTGVEIEKFKFDAIKIQDKLKNEKILPMRKEILADWVRNEYKRSSEEVSSQTPLISVIITVYKVESYLTKCIDSVLSQTYKNLEIILVDDGSPDNCGAICDKYARQDPRIQVIHKSNGGVASARNAGIKIAKGEYIGWVDGDDWIAIDMYEYLINGAQKYKTDVVICGFISVKENAFTSRRQKSDEVLTTENALRKLFSFEIRNYLCDKIWKRNLFDNIHFEEGSVFEDTKVTYQLFERARWICVLKNPKYYRLQRNDSIVNIGTVKNRLQACQANLVRYNDVRERWPMLKDIQLEEMFHALQRLRNAFIHNLGNAQKQYYDIKKYILDIKYEYKNNTCMLGRLGRLESYLLLNGHKTTFILSYIPYLVVNLKKKFIKQKKSFTLVNYSAVIKMFLARIFPAYHVALRVEKNLKTLACRSKTNVTCEECASKIEAVFWFQNSRSNETIEETKKRVFLAMPRWGGSISICQIGNFHLLRRLKAISQQHDILFWIIGGTLLGAVRHKGFIPWDDDIDVGILRKDIEKLKNVMHNYPDLKLERYYHSSGPWQTIKLTLADDKSPFWVDLLVYDFAGDPYILPEKLWMNIQKVRVNTINNLKKYKKQLKLTYRDEIIYDQMDKELIDRIFDEAIIKLPTVFNMNYIYRSVDSVSGKWQQLFPCDRIMPFCEMEFEGENFLVPKDYDWYLRLQYGDYLTIPNDIGKMHMRFISERLNNAEEFLQKMLIKEKSEHDR